MSDVERIEREAKERRERGLWPSDDVHEAEAAVDELLAMVKQAARVIQDRDEWNEHLVQERDEARALAKQLAEAVQTELVDGAEYGMMLRLSEALTTYEEQRDQARVLAKQLADQLADTWMEARGSQDCEVLATYEEQSKGWA